MLLLDVFLRFPTVTLLFVLGALCLRDCKASQQCAIAAALCLSLGMMLLNTAPESLRLPEPAFSLARIVDVPNIVLLWWFGLSLFNDNFKLGKLEWGVFLAVLVAVVPMRMMATVDTWDYWIFHSLTNRIISFAMMGHLIWTAIAGRHDDLIEARRRTRLWFTIGISLAAVIVLGAEMYISEIVGNTTDPQWLSTVRVAIITPMVVWGALWFLQFRPEVLKFEPITRPAPKEPQVDPKDTATLTRLTTAMEQDRLYREQGLGIGDLATKINVPEHQLRALINQGLGYRNFSAFLNQYRLADAKAALADPNLARTPILTLAMDAGYASLATFNRAFKTEEGVTPSQYRAEALAKL